MSIFYKLFNKKLYNTPETLYQGLKQESDPALMVLMDKVTPYTMNQGRSIKLSEDDIQSIILAAVTKHIECLRSGKYQFNGNCLSHYTHAIVDNLIRHTWGKPKWVSWEDALVISDDALPDASDKTDALDNPKMAVHKDLKITVTDEREIFENREIVHKVLSKLSVEEQNLLLQKYEQGYSDEELLSQHEKAVTKEHKEQLRQARKRARYQFQYWWLYYKDLLTPAESPKFNKTNSAREIVARNYAERLNPLNWKRP